jgi:hypothetical protein
LFNFFLSCLNAFHFIFCRFPSSPLRNDSFYLVEQKGSRQERLIIDVQLDYHNNRVYSLCKMLRITMTPSTSSTRQQGTSPRFLSCIYLQNCFCAEGRAVVYRKSKVGVVVYASRFKEFQRIEFSLVVTVWKISCFSPIVAYYGLLMYVLCQDSG